MAVNMNYNSFRKNMTDQRRRLREMVGQVDQELYENIRDTYLPQLHEDILNAVPIRTGNLAETGLSFKLTRTKKKTVSLTVSAKAYNGSYNYAYIQHENVAYSHEHGTHHYISAPFERMLQDIADMEGLDYVAPKNASDIFGTSRDYESWASRIEGE